MENSVNHKNKQQQLGRYAYFNSLPEEIISDILARIPANQLTFFKAVCKLWLSLISHPTFPNSHLHHSRSQSTHHMVILTTFSKSPTYHFGPPIFDHFSRFVKANQPSGYYDPDVDIFSVNLQRNIKNNRFCFSPVGGLLFSVKASCDGLLLVSDQYKRLFLCNPATRKYKHLPGIVDHGDVWVHRIFDFARNYDWTLFYDTAAAKYKVCLFRYHGLLFCHCLLLTVGEHSWSHFNYTYYFKPISPLVFLDNKLHWLTFDTRSPNEPVMQEGHGYQHSKQCLIFSLDLAEIKITTTYAPVEQHGQRHLLTDLNGSLCLTSFSNDQLDIFVLEDFATGVWTKQYSTSLPSLSNLPASLNSFLSDDVCVVATRDLKGCGFSGLVKVFIHDEDQLICYDLKHQKSSIAGPLGKDQRLRESYMFFSPSFVQV